MSDFVRFPESDYDKAGNVFAGFSPTSGFTLENALAMMWSAQLAYEVDTRGDGVAAQAKIDRIGQRWDLRPVTTFRTRTAQFGKTFDTTGLVAEHPRAVVLAFAGTDPAIWETVATDARFKVGPGDTHEGFQAAFEAVQAHVSAAIETSSRLGRPLFIAGHSLGAALALIAADRAATAGTPPMAVYGYGTPRPGGETFRDRYNARLGGVTYRLVHGRDIVARVPDFGNYRHVGRMLSCESNTKFAAARLSGQPVEDPKFVDAVLEEIASLLRGNGLWAVLKGLFSKPPKTFEEAFQRWIASLEPPGNGPLGNWFRLLPPIIREHLQDRYIAGLTPGVAKVRSDIE